MTQSNQDAPVEHEWPSEEEKAEHDKTEIDVLWEDWANLDWYWKRAVVDEEES